MFALFFTTSKTVCGPPPHVVNGRHSGPNRPLPNTFINYTCNEGYFPFGSSSEYLQTECLKDRSYTLGTEELADCVPIGQLF